MFVEEGGSERVHTTYTEVIYACAHAYVCTYVQTYLYSRCHYAGWSTYCVLILELLASKWHHKQEWKFM